MPKITFITPDFAVAGALAPEDFADIARLGFRSLINNRPDGEEIGQLTARQETRLAHGSGLAYSHTPAGKLDVLSEAVVDAMTDALTSLPGPVLAHCKSGLRSAIVWAAVQVRTGQDVDRLLAKLRQAGFELESLREELAAMSTNAAAAGSAARRDRAAAAA